LLFLVVVSLLLAPRPAAALDLFRDRVAPLLERRCLSCHDASTKRGGLDLSSAAGFRAGSDNGPIVQPRQPDRSLLLQVVSGPKPRMPRSGAKLAPNEIEPLRAWIAAGAVWP